MLKRITFTGIDANTNIDRLVELTKLGKEHNIDIEFGFLISGKNDLEENTNNKYPRLSLLSALHGKNLNLALHCCGKIVSKCIDKHSLEFARDYIGEENWSLFNRVQLNMCNKKNKKHLPIDNLGKTIIVQINTDCEESIDHLNVFSPDENVVFLFDKSGGNGERHSFTSLNIEGRQGFAGGIDSDNVIEVLTEIDSICSHDFWIDMEGRVRSIDENDNDFLDLDKCELVIKNAIKYINSSRGN